MEFYVGDEVVIREWRDMVDEYGLQDYDWGRDGEKYIPTEGAMFTEDMRVFCGERATVGYFDDDEDDDYRRDGEIRLSFLNESIDNKADFYTFTESMIRKYNASDEDNNDYSCDTTTLLGFLIGSM